MSVFICPHCHSILDNHQNQLRCKNGHNFGKGKSGDVNLLLPQQKRSKDPGDSKGMIVARRDFLKNGAYQKIVDTLAIKISELTQNKASIIADTGCGEGYYLRQLQKYCYAEFDNF